MTADTMRHHWLVEHETLGGHVHITLRCGLQPHGRAKAGDLVVGIDEWPRLLQALCHLPNVEFLDRAQVTT
jgi:hypothetical protein